MKKIIKRVLYTLLFLVVLIFIAGLVLAYLPTQWKIKNKGITPEEAAVLRQNYKGPHDQFTTSDGEILFLRKWVPDTFDNIGRHVMELQVHPKICHHA